MRRRELILASFGLPTLQSCGESKNHHLLAELHERSQREGLGLAESFGSTITIDYFGFKSEGRKLAGSRYWSFCGPGKLIGQTPSGILLANLDGRILARSAANIHASTAALSPDGSMIAFNRENQDEKTTGLQYGRFDARTFNLIDRSVDRGDDPNRAVTTITWSPDGRSISYARDERIYIYDLGKSQSRFFIEGTNPAWSPDGTWIAYTSPAHEPRIIQSQGNGGRTLIWKKIVWAVHWSPDGDYVAFQERLLLSGQIVIFRLRDGARTALMDWAFGPTDFGVAWVKTGPRQS